MELEICESEASAADKSKTSDGEASVRKAGCEPHSSVGTLTHSGDPKTLAARHVEAVTTGEGVETFSEDRLTAHVAGLANLYYNAPAAEAKENATEKQHQQLPHSVTQEGAHITRLTRPREKANRFPDSTQKSRD